MQLMGNKRKMVVLDGDRTTLHDVCAVAKVWYDVLPASDPRKALAWLRNEPGVSIFVTEHVDQSFDGMSLLEKVRTMHPDIQRIVMTTYSDLARLIVGLHSGAIQKLVQKPIDRVEFLTAVAPTEAHAVAVLRAASSPARAARAG
jgi:DNA-binding NtrC family response regulator